VFVSIGIEVAFTPDRCSICGYQKVAVQVRGRDGTGRRPPYCIHCNSGIEKTVPLRPLESKQRPKASKVRRLAKKQDEKVAKAIGGRVQAASGARPDCKGDVRVYGEHRVETKYTFAQSFRVTREMLNKIRSECAGLEKPALVLDFKDKGTGRTEDSWAFIPFRDWEQYVKADVDS
jgi:hypothetical protein